MKFIKITVNWDSPDGEQVFVKDSIIDISPNDGSIFMTLVERGKKGVEFTLQDGFWVSFDNDMLLIPLSEEPFMKKTAAKLVLKQEEVNCFNEDGYAVYAYFEGTPTREQLIALRGDEGLPDERMRSKPVRVDNVLSQKSGLQRWFLGFPT